MPKQPKRKAMRPAKGWAAVFYDGSIYSLEVYNAKRWVVVPEGGRIVRVVITKAKVGRRKS